VNRGEVWWLDHPDGGRRPACIVSRQAAIPVLNGVLVVPATRTLRGIASEVELGRDDGMPDDCALSFDNLGVVPKALLTERITRLGPARLAELCAALTVATGCGSARG
jgi:mRNA interferase MazF